MPLFLCFLVQTLYFPKHSFSSWAVKARGGSFLEKKKRKSPPEFENKALLCCSSPSAPSPKLLPPNEHGHMHKLHTHTNKSLITWLPLTCLKSVMSVSLLKFDIASFIVLKNLLCCQSIRELDMQLQTESQGDQTARAECTQADRQVGWQTGSPSHHFTGLDGLITGHRLQWQIQDFFFFQSIWLIKCFWENLTKMLLKY